MDWIQKLAENVLSCSSIIVDQTREGFCQLKILNSLIRSQSILVPYDCDKNHQPCLNNGKTAHWALLTGFLLVSENDTLFKKFVHSTYSDSTISSLIWYRNETLDDIELNQGDINMCTKIFVMAFHGKSKHPGLWLLKDLLMSNSQLNEFNPSRAESNVDYVLPPGEGVKALKNKFIILSKNVAQL